MGIDARGSVSGDSELDRWTSLRHVLSRTRCLVPIVVVSLAVLISACGDDSNSGGDSTASGDEPAAATDEPIVVGVATAESGWMVPFDAPALAAAKIRLKEINDAGGILDRQVKFVYADTKSDVNEAANAAVKVIDAGADLLMITCETDQGRPAALAASEKNLLVMSICASSPKWLQLPPTNYSMTFGSPTEGGAIAQWATEGEGSPGCDTAYILTDTSIDYSKSIGETYIPRYYKGDIVGKDSFKNGDPSFQSQVTRLQGLSTQPDCIFLSSYPPGGATMVRQLRAAGVDQPILSMEGMEGDFWIEAVANLSDFYAVSFASFYGDDPNGKVNDLAEQVATAMGEPIPVSTFVNGYSVMEAFERAITRAKSTETEAVKAELDKFKDEDLLLGPTTFTNEMRQSFGRPVRITQVQKGKASFLEVFEPHEIEP
jgi:branched-chain amino acid transport system substrate-binding protein